MNAPPPPYSDGTSPPDLPVVFAPRDPLKHLRRYIIEIMGFTFDADFSVLNQALGQDQASPNSILDQTEQKTLLDLATKTQDLKTKVTEGGPLSTGGSQFLTIRSCDREAVAEAVLRPALYSGLSGGYILKIVSTYAANQNDPSKRYFSFIEQMKPCLYSFWRSLAFLGPFNLVLGMFANDVWGCAHVIGTALSDEDWDCAQVNETAIDYEKVRIELGRAMDVYQREVLGITYLEHESEVFPGEEWDNLEKALISEDEKDGIRFERRAREQAMAKRRVERGRSRYSAACSR